MAEELAPRKELSRELGALSVFSIATGTMIGAGVFVLPGVAVAQVGPAAILSFLLASLVALATGLSASELATAMPRAGGTYHFLDRALGPTTGSVAGLGTWSLSILKGAFAAVAFAVYLELLVAVPIHLSAIVLSLVLLGVNLVGVRHTGAVQTVVVGLVLVGMGVFAASGLAHLGAGFTPVTAEGTPSLVIATAGLVLFGYVGIIKATAVSEEVRDPGRSLPRGILLSLVVVAVLYLVVVAVEAAVPRADLHSVTAVVDVAHILLGPLGAFLLALTGVLALASMANASILAAARYGYAMAHDRLIPALFGRVSDRFATPHISILATGVPLLFLVALVDVIILAELTAVFVILLFFLYNAATIIMRRSAPDWYQPSFRSPGYPLVQILGMVGSLSLLVFMGPLEQMVALAFVLGGIGWYLLYGRARTAPRGEFREVVRRGVTQRAVAGAEAKVEERELRVLLHIDSPEHARDILRIVSWLTGGQAAHVRCVKVEEVPEQTPLHDIEALPGRVPQELREEIARDAEEFGLETEMVELFAHDHVAGILAAASEFDVLVLDWDVEQRHGIGYRGLRRLLHDRRVDTLVFRDRGLHERERVLLAAEQGPYDELEVAVANGAAGSGGTVTLLKVLRPDAPEPQEATEREYHAGLKGILGASVESRIVRSDDPVEVIVEETAHHDLLVMRVGREPKVGETIHGGVVDRVVDRTTGSLVLTSRAEAPHRRWFRWLLDRSLG